MGNKPSPSRTNLRHVRKLQLNKETLRRLSGQQLGEAIGGAAGATPTCPSFNPCTVGPACFPE